MRLLETPLRDDREERTRRVLQLDGSRAEAKADRRAADFRKSSDPAAGGAGTPGFGGQGASELARSPDAWGFNDARAADSGAAARTGLALRLRAA
jgi:hypothetical protein